MGLRLKLFAAGEVFFEVSDKLSSFGLHAPLVCFEPPL